MKSRIYLMMILILAISCQREVSLNLFDVNNLEASFELLKEQGFSKMKDVDILIMEKINRDTIIQLEMNTKLNNIYSKSWKIKIDNNDKKTIKDFFLKRDYLLSDFTHFSHSSDYYFFCKKEYSKKRFKCEVLKEENQYYLYVIYTNSNVDTTD